MSKTICVFGNIITLLILCFVSFSVPDVPLWLMLALVLMFIVNCAQSYQIGILLDNANLLKKNSQTDQIKVYTANDVVEAHLIVSKLMDAGVNAYVVNENLTQLHGAIPITPDCSPEVWLRLASQETKAKMIIREHLNQAKI